MPTTVFCLEYLCPHIVIISIVEGCSQEEVEDFVVEGLGVQVGMIEVEEYHEEGSVVEVEGLLLLLKLCREGDLCIG